LRRPPRLSINPPAEDLGGKNSVKEKRQGCLSRPGRPLFEPFFEGSKSAAAGRKDFFDRPGAAEGGPRWR
ncbi:hypothetical protein PND94_20005, partial [Flavonifractor plautii]|uniref:hypothetical protein n=1 Tax=Flavonifractor plautii TaxID=292800 RepID=UPI00232F53E9